MSDWLLYEHEDGRHEVAPTAAAATFAHGDPAWHRVGPVEVPWSTWPSNGRRFYEALRSADPVEFPDEWADLTPTWRSGMEQAARTYGVGGNERVSHQRQTHPYRSAAGDTLASIALAELRDMNRWPEILSLNTHVLDGAAGPGSKPRAGTLLTLPSPSTARQQEVGSGWKLVPMEPTQEMLRAGLSVHEFGWCEASEDISECGVLTEAGITQADADAINAESMTQQAEIYRAMLAAAPSTPENAGGVPASGEAEPTIREQTLAGLVKRLAWLAPKDHAARIAATECLQRYGYLSPLRADVSGVQEAVSQTPPPLGTDGGTPQ